MTTITRTWGRGPASPDQRRQLILLAGLGVILALLLVWQLPKLIGGSSSSSDAIVTASEVAAPATAQASTGVQTGIRAGTSRPADARTELWIKRHAARDPFVPLAGNEPAAPATTLASAPAPTLVETPAAQPASPAAPESNAPATGATKTPVAALVTAKPSIAVLYANGEKQAVGVGEYFDVRDLWFRLEALEPNTIELSLVDGGFSSGRQTITVSRDHPITLANSATGVEYTLRFARATSGIATTSQAEPTEAPAATATDRTPAAPATTTNES